MKISIMKCVYFVLLSATRLYRPTLVEAIHSSHVWGFMSYDELYANLDDIGWDRSDIDDTFDVERSFEGICGEIQRLMVGSDHKLVRVYDLRTVRNTESQQVRTLSIDIRD